MGVCVVQRNLHHRVSCILSIETAPNSAYLVCFLLEEVALTSRFTGFHIKASPGQLQKHLWNVCWFFFFLSRAEILGFCETFYERPLPKSPRVCVFHCGKSDLQEDDPGTGSSKSDFEKSFIFAINPCPRVGPLTRLFLNSCSHAFAESP